MKRNSILILLCISIIAAACGSAESNPNQTSSGDSIPSGTSDVAEQTNAAAIPTSTAIPSSIVEVTYYDLSGFLVEIDGNKILIDTLFDSFPGHNPPQEGYDQMLAGEPPFDDIDLVLTTHNHVDHFSAEVMSAFLSTNPETILITTYQAYQDLTAFDADVDNLIYSIDIGPGETETVSIPGVEIECLYISHGDDSVLNLGFIVTVGEVSFFHSGDMHGQYVPVEQLVEYGLPDKELDFVLVVYLLFNSPQYYDHITEGIKSNYIIPTHYTYNAPFGPVEAFPDVILFTDTMQTWQMP